MTSLTSLGIRRPKWVAGLSIGVTGIALLLAALPSIWPESFSRLNGLRVDTDPENMLSADNPAREFHRSSKAEFLLYDQIVLGVVNESHPQGVFNSDTLGDIYDLTEYAKSIDGVVSEKVVAPSTIDNIEQAGLGAVSFNWLMDEPPHSDEEALIIRDNLLDLPLMNGSAINEDGDALILYIPIVSKDQSHRISTLLLENSNLSNPAATPTTSQDYL